MNDHKSALIFLLLGLALSWFPIYMIRKGLRLSGAVLLIGALGFFPAAYGTYVGKDFCVEFGVVQFFTATLVRATFGRRIVEYDRKRQVGGSRP